MDPLVCQQLEFDFGMDRKEITDELRKAASNVIAFVNSGSKEPFHQIASEADKAVYDSIAHHYFESVDQRQLDFS